MRKVPNLRCHAAITSVDPMIKTNGPRKKIIHSTGNDTMGFEMPLITKSIQDMTNAQMTPTTNSHNASALFIII